MCAKRTPKAKAAWATQGKKTCILRISTQAVSGIPSTHVEENGTQSQGRVLIKLAHVRMEYLGLGLVLGAAL